MEWYAIFRVIIRIPAHQRGRYGQTGSNSVVEKPAITIQQSPGESLKKKPSFKEKREFELLDKEIKELNREKEEITDKLSAGTRPFEELQKLSARIAEISSLVDEKEMRWLELSELVES